VTNSLQLTRSKKQYLATKLAELLSRPVGWDKDSPRTLHVFNTDEEHRKDITQLFETYRVDIEKGLGGSLQFVFHSSLETQLMYPETSKKK
jgi:hypothetical protein